jgi:hypothetical protein
MADEFFTVYWLSRVIQPDQERFMGKFELEMPFFKAHSSNTCCLDRYLSMPSLAAMPTPPHYCGSTPS